MTTNSSCLSKDRASGDLLAGQRVVLAGKFAGMSKRDVQQLVRSQGGAVVERADAAATLLVVGENELPFLEGLGDDVTGPAVREAVDRGTLKIICETQLWQRLGLVDRITRVLPKPAMMPAVGQGALGLEARAGDDRTLEKLASLDDLTTHRAVLAERSMLAALRGGCLAPVGAWARTADDGMLHLDGVVLSHDGARRLAISSVGPSEDASQLGEEVAAKLIDLGADELIAASRQPS